MTVQELKAKAASRYEGALKKVLLGEDPFPVGIAYKRPRPSEDPAKILRLKEMLRSQSKETIGFGPTVQFAAANTRRYGNAKMPGSVTFTTLEDLVRYIGKEADTKRILQNAAVVTREFPGARSWTAARLQLLSKEDVSIWNGIVQVAKQFIINPKPWVYPRELSLGLHTKFLEENHGPVIDLLSEIAPEVLNEPFASWQDRLGLRSSSELVEGRFLDPTLAPYLPQHMLAAVGEWNRCTFSMPSWVLITENRTSLLTLPSLSGCLALLGKGYAVTRLAQITRLHHTQVYYWGDIDQHGFEILASLRSLLPKTSSCLMDEETLFHCHANIRTNNSAPTLAPCFVSLHLNIAERALWQKCATQHLRFEQEHVPYPQ